MELSTDEFNNLRNISKSISKRVFKYNKINYEEGWLQGCLGIAEALRSYDPNKGTSFRTYCYSAIQNNIYTYYTKIKKTYLKTTSLDYMADELFINPAIVDYNYGKGIDIVTIKKKIDKYKKHISKNSKGERKVKIYEMRYEKGMSLKDIGIEFNTSRSNIGAICTKLERNIIDYIKGD